MDSLAFLFVFFIFAAGILLTLVVRRVLRDREQQQQLGEGQRPRRR